MNTISITTSQNIAVDYELGSLGDRILGRIIDGCILFAYGLVILAIIGFSNFFDFVAGNMVLTLVLILPILFYDLLCEVVLNGQSVGKRVMDIKVVSLNGEQPALSQYLIRWVFRLIDFTFTGSIVALVMVAVTDKKQRLGDLLAGTVLVKTNNKTSFADTIYTPTPSFEYRVTYPEVVNLRDADIQLVKDVLVSVSKSRNPSLAYQAQQKLEDVLSIRSQHQEPTDFLRMILADYNHLTAQL
ncbi:RDD family protein [Aridibaculum aurantiacum]|uniref:RDD family protein n=1 Tax=Aridibaculum aurantiacum TaxID=2810307 RepID=UPI001A96074B|nr:RDD family protein [Aridibaculum aurantiacum]